LKLKRSRKTRTRAAGSVPAPFQYPAVPGANGPSWEMIEDGRYMPRRTRGSFPGRELG
jgi:hypothetical protein